MTNDRPYTDADLRAEATRQHYLATIDLDFMGIGEQMAGTPVSSMAVDLEDEIGEPLVLCKTWDQFSRDDFDAAQRAIDDLLSGAADVSGWAINLGADGLVPHGAVVEQGAGEYRMRLHFAFSPALPEETRCRLVAAVERELSGDWPYPQTSGEPCSARERLAAHAEGEHAFCGPECSDGGEAS